VKLFWRKELYRGGLLLEVDLKENIPNRPTCDNDSSLQCSQAVFMKPRVFLEVNILAFNAP